MADTPDAGSTEEKKPDWNPIRFAHPVEIANAILETDHFAKDPGGLLYHFDGKTYVPGAEALIRERTYTILVKNGFDEKWNIRKGQETIEAIRILSAPLWDKPKDNLLILRNGTLDLETMKMGEHSPDNRTTVWLPVNYEPKVKCPAWERFVGEVFPSDAQQLAWEIPALLMTPDTSVQKGTLLYGQGSNGKSRYLAGLTAFLGGHNVVGMSLQRLEMDRFAVSNLYGKLANICPDLPSENLESTSMFKALTGGDRVTAERKFKDMFEFLPFCRLIFSANHLPHSRDASYAYFRRWNILHFERTFDASDRISPVELDARLGHPKELSGLLNKALAVLPELRKRGDFTAAPSIQEMAAQFQEVSDPLATWAARHIHENPKAITPKYIFLNAYNNDHQGQAPVPAISFGMQLKKRMPQITDVQKTVDGKMTWCFVGIEYRA